MRNQRNNSSAAFVAVEFIAIVAVLVLLAGIILPAMGRFKSASLSARCVNNHKQVVHAWLLYAHDYSGKCANNFTIPDTQNTMINGTLQSWANNIMTWEAGGAISDRSVTNEAWARGIMHPYTSGDIEIYRCPADRYLSPVQRARGYEKRLRTIAMNCLIGRLDTSPTSASGRSWAFGGAYRQWLSVRSIPNPATTFLTLDEHPDSVNDGLFINDPAASLWGDIPGALHDNATTFSFTDGHAELRRWRGTSTRIPVRFMYTTPRPFDANGRKDFTWYRERMGLVR